MLEKEFFLGKVKEGIAQDKLLKLKKYGACVVSDAMGGFNAMSGAIKSQVQGKSICGRAITVGLRPGDKLLLHKAIEIAEPGDVLVIATGCDYRHAVIGGIMSYAAFTKKKIAGLVVDGAVRDIEEIRANGYPVFAAAIVPNTGDNEGPGMLNKPISCGNVPVLPGDIIVADDNGVAVVPADDYEYVLQKCGEKILKEEQRKKEIDAGHITAQGILDKLEKKGY
jgi:regulator of RNase E activity RraA